MKKDGVICLISVTALFVGFLFGMAYGRSVGKEPVQIQPVLYETQPGKVDEQINQNTSDGKININTAPVETLALLPGIGEILAQRIVEYREANGPFSSIYELTNVYGIGQQTMFDVERFIKLED